MNKEITENNDANHFFSIVILFWNNEKYIERCLQSLKNQTYKNFEIILINNGSDQPFPNELDLSSIKVIYLELPKNIGFAAGNNHGAKVAKGKYLITLNADAFPEPEWLEKIFSAIEKHPDCSFASKLVMANDPTKLDGTGDVYHFTGLVWRKNYNRLAENVTLIECEVFSACGAAAVYPKGAFDRVGGFDPDYFSYVEDVDLGFRLILAGYRCIFLPNAVVHHVGSGSTGKRSDFSAYYGQRNLIWTFFKNMPGLLFWVLLPIHIIMNALMIFFSFFRKQGKITIKAKIDAM
ncbi:MAG TPA: glycosyltransferase family 2 protein, partial [Draconibacterium sp.]|nr:glycosyltransferase family 2 protein [Draconibacterium sp.]